MFSNLGLSEIVIILVAGIIILGPEKIPSAVSSFSKTVKKIRILLEDTSGKLKDEFGDEIKFLAEPIEQINDIKNLSAKKIIGDNFLNSANLDPLNSDPVIKEKSLDKKNPFDPDAT